MKSKTLRYDIQVNFIAENDIEAAINPIVRDDGSIDESALSEYQEFLINVFSILDENEFEVIEDHESDRSSTSHYMSAYKKDALSGESIKCIIFIRISDHDLARRSEDSRKSYYKSEAERLKQPKSKKKQTWRFYNIVVNGQKFNSYDEALEAINRKLK